ncbi:MAG: hypothetical protein BGP10_12275 [Rhodanobacter sp. 68-29]|nr:hypothetical protein [Rhodanobacter sp.]ODV27964.1 MAG: hypothetical protein ABT19_00195 [Rhodanobacter sp. SCN 68-63]OJY60668.1 MAG: hypothetical protein BGP10_12275 [Rhodanobacter sp. 68-29]
MSTLPITVEYIPGMGAPAICVGSNTHTLDIGAADQLVTDLQFAILRARIDAKKRSAARRLVTPENEVEQLLQMVDLRLSTPDTFPASSPASEVTP